MIVDNHYILELMHAVKHPSIWGIVCRNATIEQMDELIESLQSQSKDNYLMMREILGKKLFYLINPHK